MWYYKGIEFIEPDENIAGFVYVITDTDTHRKYIGQKKFWKTVRYKTKPKKRIKPSDWMNYYGSSKDLKADIEEHGKDRYFREIIRMCNSKAEMNYVEMREQIVNNVLFRDDYYNNFVGGRINGNHLRFLKEEYNAE